MIQQLNHFRLEFMVGRAKNDLDKLEKRVAEVEASQTQQGPSSSTATIRAYMPQFLFVSIRPYINA
jgi:hypothetical protein